MDRFYGPICISVLTCGLAAPRETHKTRRHIYLLPGSDEFMIALRKQVYRRLPQSSASKQRERNEGAEGVAVSRFPKRSNTTAAG